MKHLLFIAVVSLFSIPYAATAEEEKHLLILSGQSNMANLDPSESFTPTVEKELGKERVLVVHNALGAKPILRWCKDWKPAGGNKPARTGDLYERLMDDVRTAIKGEQVKTVTLVWMQGEADTKDREHGEVYGASLTGLHAQLSRDLDRKDVNFVIGRLSDFDMENETRPFWTTVREAQVEVAKSSPRFDWVDTDDLNGEKDSLHYTSEGYKVLGERFAKKAVELIMINAQPDAARNADHTRQ